MVTRNTNSYGSNTDYEVTKMEPVLIRMIGMCTKCGFYNDCPMEYLCPPAEILFDIVEGKYEADKE